jgi:ElaB/YqjD/DUF883 family membrane-anchored ribosome-binding protein
MQRETSRPDAPTTSWGGDREQVEDFERQRQGGYDLTRAPRSGESFDGSSEQQGGGMQGNMQHAMETGKAKAGDMAHNLQERTEQGRERAADGLANAASQLRSNFAGDGEGVKGQVGVKVADSLERTAGYLREHETDQIWSDVETFVTEHPVQAAAGALVAGFVLGRVLR